MLSLAISFLLILLFLFSIYRKQKKYQFLPPGPVPIPLLGTPKYIGDKNACKYFPELRKKYGHIFTIWKLSDPIVVLCGFEMVKDALINHSEEFSGRPFLAVLEEYGKGYAFPNIHGERWRQLRRFTMSALRNFGMGRMTMENHVLEESKYLIKAVSEKGGKAFNPISLMGAAIGNISSSTLLGENFNYHDPKFQDLLLTIRKFIVKAHSPLYELVNTFPILMKIPILKKRLFEENVELEYFVKEYIEQHKQTLNPDAPRDFIDYFLVKIKEEEHSPNEHFCETSLLKTVVDLFATGIVTTSCTLNYALILISNFPEVQAKVHQEIDNVTKSQRPPGIMDRAQMPYTNAVIHEIQRVLDLAPTAHYHSLTKDIYFRGYTIPKGTTVIPFLSSVLFDPTQWETPTQFNPGHFLDDKGRFKSKSAFMAFSAGKRICAGESLARMELFLLFCALLQKFTFTLPSGTEREGYAQLKRKNMNNHFFSKVCAKPRSPFS